MDICCLCSDTAGANFPSAEKILDTHLPVAHVLHFCHPTSHPRPPHAPDLDARDHGNVKKNFYTKTVGLSRGVLGEISAYD